MKPSGKREASAGIVISDNVGALGLPSPFEAVPAGYSPMRRFFLQLHILADFQAGPPIGAHWRYGRRAMGIPPLFCWVAI